MNFQFGTYRISYTIFKNELICQIYHLSRPVLLHRNLADKTFIITIVPTSHGYEVIEIMLGLADGLENIFAAALERLVLHLYNGAAIIAYVVERGDERRPVHIAEAGDLRDI